MGKVFRLFKDGANTYNDWNASPDYPYDSTNRDTIIDPEGATASKEITSIPSPFARIDLVKNAFRYICRQNNNKSYHDGNTIYHKLVSETLDVGEVFFNISKFRNDIEIIKWNPKQDIERLMRSGIAGNECLADVLTKYLKSDSSAYNFEKMQSMYLLNYKRGPEILNIIGATSPATVFFSNANDLQYVGDNINFGQHKPFGTSFEPLYKRDAEYIKAWFAFRRSILGFASLFPEINDYLNQTFAAIKDEALKDSLLEQEETSETFGTINLPDASADFVELLGYKIYSRKLRRFEGSDFEIKATCKSQKPLVLPSTPGNVYKDLQYTSSKWGARNAAPLNDKRKLEERTLPYDGIKQPYLTIGDLLEDSIVTVPHNLNKRGYFDGNVQMEKADECIAFLLPVKPMYFDFFTVKDLCGVMPDGKKTIELHVNEDGEVRVTLRIPIRGNGSVSYMEYVRKYSNNKSESIYGITKIDATGILMPNVEFDSDDEAYYTAALVSTDNDKDIDLEFYKGSSFITDITKASRTTSEDVTKSQTYTLAQKRFDYIRVNVGNRCAGLIVPHLKKNSAVNVFEFAIDLGTSYTHIEFKEKSDAESRAFAYDETESMMSEMFLPLFVEKNGKSMQWDLLDERPFIEKDYLPVSLGKDSRNHKNQEVDFYFPTQTVLSCARSLSWDKAVNAFSLVNIPFAYGKRRDLPHDKYEFNIKWGTDKERIALDKYVECLMLMIRNKVVSNNGDLSKTIIKWFYPQSMPQNRLNLLCRVWDEKYNKYFKPAPAQTKHMLESIAPVRYYFNKIASSSEFVNIDIGGGTTDIAFAKDNDVRYVTSFRYAMNDLFSDSIAENNLENGIIDSFKHKIRKVLEENGLTELVAVMDSYGNRRPENMAAFLFALKDNKMVKNLDSKLIDFDYILETDSEFKIVFLLFYTAVIYHVAQIIKAKGMGMPRHIAFSGNGGYVVNILSSDNRSVSRYTKDIIKAVTGNDADFDLDIVGLEYGSNPKTVTCKGGLIAEDSQKTSEPQEIILKAQGNEFVCFGETYGDITDESKKCVVKAVEDFFDFALEKLPSITDIENLFGVSGKSVSNARQICFADLHTYLDKAVAKSEGGEKNKGIEETLFFGPIKGALNALTKNIYDQNK